MHATLREEELNVRKPNRRIRLRHVVAGGLCGLVVLALSMTAALHAGRQAMTERVSSLAARFGVVMDVDFVTFDFMDGLALEGLRVRAPEPHDLDIVIDRATLDLGLWALISGQRRPSAITLETVHAQGRLDRRALDWIRGEHTAAPGGEAAASPSSGWQGAVEIVDGSATLDLRLDIDGLPRTGQSVSFHGWSARLEHHAASQLEATGVISIDGQQRTAQLVLRSGPDAAIHVDLDDAVGLRLSGVEPQVQVQLDGVNWTRRRGSVQLQQVAVERGDTRLAIGHIELAGGTFPWLGADAPRSLALHDMTGRVAGRRTTVERGAITLDPPDADAAPWAPNPREVRLEGVRVGTDKSPLRATLQRLTLGLDQARWRAALAGDHAGLSDPGALIESIDLQGPAVTAEIAELALLEDTAVGVAQGPGERSDWLDKLVANDGPLVIPGGTDLLPHLRDHRLTVTHGRFVARSESGDSGSTTQLDDVSVTWAPNAAGGGTASTHALVRRNGVPSGRLDVTAAVDAQGAIRSAKGAVSGAGFAHVLSKMSEYVTVQPEAWLKADFAYTHTSGQEAQHRVEGELRFEDFGFEAWRISHTPVAGLEGVIRYQATVEPETRRVSLEIVEATMGGAQATGGVTLALRPDKKPVVEAHMAMPKQDCGKLARAVPRALMPRLTGLELAGSLWVDAKFSVDLEDPNTLALDVDGSVDQCRVVTLGGDLDLEALAGDFVHHPIEPKRGRRDDISVGRGTPQWIPARQLPRYLRAAAIATEDRAYRQHQGVRWDLIAKALRLNLEKGRFVYGGSTITQQLVKNLYLTREKTLSRKLEELVISWQLERLYDKEELLELYVNVIEYGPNIYGVRKASHYYFGKPPWHLNPAEAAFIMGLKPYPRAGHRQWQAQRLNAWWLKRVRNVMRSVQRNEGALTNAQIAAAPAQVTFRPPGGSFWSGVADTKVSANNDAAAQGQ